MLPPVRTPETSGPTVELLRLAPLGEPEPQTEWARVPGERPEQGSPAANATTSICTAPPSTNPAAIPPATAAATAAAAAAATTAAAAAAATTAAAAATTAAAAAATARWRPQVGTL